MTARKVTRAVDIDIWRIYTSNIQIAAAAAARLNRRVLAGEDLIRGRVGVYGETVRYKLRALALQEDGE